MFLALVNGAVCGKTWSELVLEFEVEFTHNKVRRWCLGRFKHHSPPSKYAGRLALYNHYYVLPLPELNDRQKVTVPEIRRLLPDLMFSGFHVMCMSEY